MPSIPMPALGRELFGSTVFGLAMVTLFVAGGIAWSLSAPLSGAVIAQGQVAFEGERKTVQHLEGGIIKEIRVSEGDRIKAGDVLLTLDDTSAQARADELLGRIRALAGEEARLRAERAHQPRIVFEHPFLQDRRDPEIAAVLDQQESLLKARIGKLKTRKSILLKRIDQLSQQKNGLTKQLVGVREQLRLVREEEAAVADLYDKGYARRPHLLAIRRAVAEFVANEGEILAGLARIGEQVNETQLQIAGLETDLIEEVDNRLAQVQAERTSAEKLYRETLDRRVRTSVIAPADGIILDVRFKTVGGVVPPGEPILDIAPVQDRLVINSRIQTTDVDEVAIGSRVTVVFPAYSQHYRSPIRGRVVRVSADALQDRDSRESYYAVAVEIDRQHLDQVTPGIQLMAGMPAEIYIVTAERTLYDFLAEPISRIFARALRES